jgi:hypothetical protein
MLERDEETLVRKEGNDCKIYLLEVIVRWM